jgi:hypothetical protein
VIAFLLLSWVAFAAVLIVPPMARALVDWWVRRG